MSSVRFDPPANLAEMSEHSRAAWDARLREWFAFFSGKFPNFFDPIEVGEEPNSHRVTWLASPARLLSTRMSDQRRWEIADGDRKEQDEYCEWSVARDDAGKISRVTFTCEVPDYYDILLETDQSLLLDLYEEMAGERPELSQITQVRDGIVLLLHSNPFNSAPDGPIVHLSQHNNNLFAAVTLAAEATVLREIDGELLKDPQSLVLCGGLGDERRHSDPQIGAALNRFVAAGSDVSLAQPAGLYIDELVTTGFETPDGTDAQEFWHIQRGNSDHVLRAVFEVPGELNYVVGDITIGGQPIDFGAQIADRVQVRIEALSKPSGSAAPKPQPCVDP